MKRVLSILLLVVTIGLVSCSSDNSTSLIVYYSQTGNTLKIAHEAMEILPNADTLRLELVEPYPSDVYETIKKVGEQISSASLPKLKKNSLSLENYDTIYLCFPVWYGKPALPVISFLKQNDLRCKVIVPICTFRSGDDPLREKP